MTEYIPACNELEDIKRKANQLIVEVSYILAEHPPSP